GEDRWGNSSGAARVREKDPRKGDQSFGGLQRGRRGRRNFDHERKGNPRPSEEMGNKETQTQVKKNGQRGRIDWSMAPTLRNVLRTQSRANGVRPENRA